MKAFKFRLERVLRLRASQLKMEEFKLEQLVNRGLAMRAEVEAWDISLRQMRSGLDQKPFLQSFELITFEQFNKRAQRDRVECMARIAAHDQVIEKQRSVVVAARGGCRLLEKLQEKQRADWQVESDKELAELASEFSAAKWIRSRHEAR